VERGQDQQNEQNSILHNPVNPVGSFCGPSSSEGRSIG
jgi:hypothetical protein